MTKEKLRVFYAVHDQGNHDYHSKTWYNNLYLSMCDIAEVVRFNYDLYHMAMQQDFTKAENRPFIEKEKRMIESQLLNQIRQHHQKKPIDIFFSYFATAYCSPQILFEIADMGITTVNWFCNAAHQFHLVKDIAPAYDYSLFPEKFREEDYIRVGANPMYCQEAANPNIYKPYKVEKQYDVSFVGGRYADRYLYIEALHNAGIKVNAFGENWVRKKEPIKELLRPVYNLVKGKSSKDSVLGGYLSDEEMIKTYSLSKINLGFAVCGETHLTPKPLRHVRLRDFEVPMSGGFYLAEYTEELAECFEPDQEVVYFKAIEECIDKARYYLHHEIEREKIRQAGYERAHRDHTWQKRLSHVFENIKLRNQR